MWYKDLEWVLSLIFTRQLNDLYTVCFAKKKLSEGRVIQNIYLYNLSQQKKSVDLIGQIIASEYYSHSD